MNYFCRKCIARYILKRLNFPSGMNTVHCYCFFVWYNIFSWRFEKHHSVHWWTNLESHKLIPQFNWVFYTTVWNDLHIVSWVVTQSRLVHRKIRNFRQKLCSLAIEVHREIRAHMVINSAITLKNHNKQCHLGLIYNPCLHKSFLYE